MTGKENDRNNQVFGDAKKLGFGLMRLPLKDEKEAGSIDMEQMKQMVDLFLEKGFTYFDTAWMYCAFQSENAVREALVKRHPRESFTLATKLHSSYFDDLDGRDRVFGEQLQKTGAGYFDYYLLHAISSESYDKYEQFSCFRWLREKKEQGLVRHMGFSFHDTAAFLDRVLTEHPETEFVQLQLNYLDWESEKVQSRACYEAACRHQVPVIVMEPVKGGTLSSLPPEAEELLRGREPEKSLSSWAIRFAASLPNVKMVLSGMSTLAQMTDNLSYMEDFQPLTKEETALCLKAAEIIRAQIAVPCTGCSYCTEGCPMRIAIPQYFSLFNEDYRETLGRGWAKNSDQYEELTKKFGAAKDCIACGQCESVCPQHLPVIESLKKVAERYTED